MQESRKEKTKELSKRMETFLLPRKDFVSYAAREVSFDTDTNHKIRVDYIRFRPLSPSVSGIEKGDFYCYEVKSSVQDFHSPNGHNFLGDYNYYVMPAEVYQEVKEEIPFSIGVLAPKDFSELHTLYAIKPAKRMDRKRSSNEILFAMLRSALRDKKERKK